MGELFYWRPLQHIGLEELHLLEDAQGIRADGLVMGSAQAPPFRLEYQIRMDRVWQIEECALRLVRIDRERDQSLFLSSDGQGRWIDGAGEPCSRLDGCLDLDISCAPFTNTLPIRRLALSPGESADLLVVFLELPALSVRPVRQRYTCVSHTASGWRYRYEALESRTTFDLLVDAQGLVVEYPGVWQRAEVTAQDDHSPQSAVVLDGFLASHPIRISLTSFNSLASLLAIGTATGRDINLTPAAAKQQKARFILPGRWMAEPSRMCGSFPLGKSSAVDCPSMNGARPCATSIPGDSNGRSASRRQSTARFCS